MAREMRRDSEDKLNFLGGKRAIKSSTAAAVAIAKLKSETGGMLQPRTLQNMNGRRVGFGVSGKESFPFVHWGAASKYALFMWELTDPLDICVDIRSTGVEGAKRLEWVSRSDLKR